MEVKKRNEIPEELKWNLHDLVKDDVELKERLKKIESKALAFVEDYKDKLDSTEKIKNAIEEFMAIIQEMYILDSFASLYTTVDMGDAKSNERYASTSGVIVKISSMLSFLKTEIAGKSDDILNKLASENPELEIYIRDIMKEREHMLDPKTESTLSALNNTLSAPYDIYQMSKLVDMDFGKFEVDGREYDLSYNIFEGVMESETETKVRRKAFDIFHSILEKYKYTTATCYSKQIQKEKTMSELRGFDSVFDYLLFDQKVSRKLYDRQIDIIMKELAPHMRKYARLLKRVHGLDKMTYADLKLNLDPEYEPKVDISKAKDYIMEGLSILGDDYQKMLERAFSERWIDFANNHGKSTGAFCSSPYGSHSYILISWTSLMAEVMVLAHELGHAGHYYLCQRNQNILGTSPSLYFIEAPSTANEIIMEMFLLDNAKDLRERRWVLSQIIARTYYHNFVTHFMEAAYQREVYKIIDKGGSVQADTLSNIFKEKLEEFWGEDVEIIPGSELTWMRQPHYYMGLYPYTYSAGLTIGTQVSKRILKEGKPAVEDWIKTLKAGGTKTPVELAEMAGVDIKTDKALRDTIDYIGSVIDELEEITDKLEI
ncbi:MAG: oligoendopeptidase F [Tissierellia bacterium]|nr:oligoendopeptidase F [Tissierellia bacterium]